MYIAENPGKTEKLLVVIRLCEYSNCAESNPNHEYVTNILIGQ